MDDEKLVRQIGDELLGRVNAPEQEVYRAVREIVLPIIAREVAAETERCARVADGFHIYWTSAAPRIAAAIRGRAINAAMDASEKP